MILSVETEFLRGLINEFILKENRKNIYSQSIAFLIFSNCLAVADSHFAAENQLKYSDMNTLTTSDGFLTNLFDISLYSSRIQFRENALNCIFSIIYNNDSSFAYSLVVNPKLNIIALLLSQTQSALTKELRMEVLRIFCLLTKRLKFPAL
jgi:hypothetical protein